MRTVKHLIYLVDFNEKNESLKLFQNLKVKTKKEQINEFLSVIYQCQRGKNYFLQKLNENNWNNLINFNHNTTLYDICKKFRQSEEAKQLVEKTDLKARMWAMALDEAYNTHLRTMEATLAKIKQEVNQKLFNNFKKDKLLQSFKFEFELLQYLTNTIFF